MMKSLSTPALGAAEIDLDALEAHVQSQLHGRIHDLRLVAGEDGLRLRGCAHSYYVKQLAQHAVMRATNRRIAANEIEVR
jgi:hypothetical protein